MKYVIIIPEGAADAPLEELDGLTPLEAADTPYLDEIARTGRQGTAAMTPDLCTPGPDVSMLALLGYDPRVHHPGWAPLEAAAVLGNDDDDRDVTHLESTDWIFRGNLVSVSSEGCLVDHRAGRIGSAEAGALLESLAEAIAGELGNQGKSLELVPGHEHRSLLIDRSGCDCSALVTTAPHDIIEKPLEKHRPHGAAGGMAALLDDIMALSRTVFADHDVNLTRREMGELQASQLWIWGQGRPVTLPQFSARTGGLRGALVTDSDLHRGIARLIGWSCRCSVPDLDIPGALDAAAQSAASSAIDALGDDHHDIVCVHLEAPDAASHLGDFAGKISSIQAIDQFVVGPLLAHLRSCHESEWRILVTPGHFTRIDTRAHDSTPPPFAMAGTAVTSVVQTAFSEKNAAQADLHIDAGHDLMEYFLFGGLPVRW